MVKDAMSEFTAEVGQNGRVVIPIAIRTKENIQQGDIVTLGLFVVKKGKA